MNKMVLIGGIGAVGAVVMGVGVSLAHSNGVFGPDTPDWLELSQQSTVAAPAAPSEPDVSSAVTAAVADAIVTPVPQEDVQPVVSYAPVMSQHPHARPVEVAPVRAPVLTPTVAPETQTMARVQPAAPAIEFEPLDQFEVQSRAKTPLDENLPTAQFMATPTAPSNSTGVGDVWLLGVFR